MEKLNMGQAILFYGLILITTERVSAALKIAVAYYHEGDL
jgi:hypothetical protein